VSDIDILVDHSCGHDRQRDNARNFKRMSKFFGWKQPCIHESKIEKDSGYLGKNNPELKVGDTQSMF
jgi:hypothetical protein